jgi:hypothetical protein
MKIFPDVKRKLTSFQRVPPRNDILINTPTATELVKKTRHWSA